MGKAIVCDSITDCYFSYNLLAVAADALMESGSLPQHGAQSDDHTSVIRLESSRRNRVGSYTPCDERTDCSKHHRLRRLQTAAPAGYSLRLFDPQADADPVYVELTGGLITRTNVVDVAELLGMSPGNIYRFFSSKKALLEAVAVRWMDEMAALIEAIAADRARPASDRLAQWFDHLRRSKRRKLIDEPELFRVYLDIVGDARKAADEHVKMLLRQVERIIKNGKASGEFSAITNPKSTARAFLHATSAFHHPVLVMQRPAPTEAEARALLRLVLGGLQAGGQSGGARTR